MEENEETEENEKLGNEHYDFLKRCKSIFFERLSASCTDEFPSWIKSRRERLIEKQTSTSLQLKT